MIALFGILLAGCGVSPRPFKYTSETATSTSGTPPPPLDGKVLYETNCSACHGPLTSSAKAGADPVRIRAALATIPFMAPLKTSLTEPMIEAIGKTLLGTYVLPTCATAPDVGHSVPHRLNNLEYDNSLNAILGTTKAWSVQLSFPLDESMGNFNNNAQTHYITPAHVQRYLTAAETALNEVFATPTLKSRLINCNTAQASCVDNLLRSFLLKAFRRPPTANELSHYTGIVALAQPEGDTPERGVQLAMTTALISPYFLFRTLVMPNPADPASLVQLNGYDLASRMSYFLWSSMPDDQLLAQAANGQLLNDATLTTQVQRMLKDPKAAALVDVFASQWLALNKLPNASPSAAVFPSFDENLRSDMQTESRMVLQDMLTRDASFFDLVNLNSTFINQRLAEHYGLAGVTGTQFRKVALTGTERTGLLTHASVLTVHSAAERSSIIKRGQWVLSNFICDPLPPPPPDIGSLPPANAADGLTERERLVAHRNNPACIGCHSKMDPIGFALENFDGIGRFRLVDNGKPIDNTGELPDGRIFKGSLQLAAVLSGDPRFKACVAEKMFTYALGRQPQTYDRCTINRIGLEKVGPTQPMSSSILELIKSEPFRRTRGAP